MESLDLILQVKKLEEHIKELIIFSLEENKERYKLIDEFSKPGSDPEAASLQVKKIKRIMELINFLLKEINELYKLIDELSKSRSDPTAVSGGKRRKNKTRKSRR